MATQTMRYFPAWASGQRVLPGDATTPAAIWGGVVAGWIAGIAMALVAMLYAGLQAGGDFWAPVKGIAALFYGPGVMAEGIGAILVGLVIHLFVSGIIGGLFGLWVGARYPALASLLWGLLYGAIIWAVMTFLVLPYANTVLAQRVDNIPGWWFAYHMIFGGMLFLTPLLARSFADRRSAVVESDNTVVRP